MNIIIVYEKNKTAFTLTSVCTAVWKDRRAIEAYSPVSITSRQWNLLAKLRSQVSGML